MLAELENGSNGELEKVDLLARVHQACFYRTGTLALHNGGRVIARSSPSASPPQAPLAAITEHGDGRVVVLADSDLFGDDCIGELDNESLWLNLVYWAAQPAFAGVQAVIDSPAPLRPELGGAQGGRRGAAADPGARRLGRPVRARRRAASPSSSRRSRAPPAAWRATSPIRRTTSTPCVHDLRAWVDSDFAKPDFVRSLEAFRPERDRRDGIEHLVVFPMYKQNASRDTCFEALIVRVPWPAFVAELERSGYDNPKFVPVNFVDYTAGYDSECAVLFPETFSTAERPPSHFGGIFCDREAERFRRVVRRRRRAPAASTCRPTPPAF